MSGSIPPLSECLDPLMALSSVILYKRVVKFQLDGRRLDDGGTIIPKFFCDRQGTKQTDGLIEDLIDKWMDELIDGLKAE